MTKISENHEGNNANTVLVAVIDKQVKELSSMLIELMNQEINPNDFNEISEKITELKEYMVSCRSYNGN